MGLSIEITNLDTRRFALTRSLEGGSRADPSEFYGLRYSSTYPGGFEMCSFKLNRPAHYDYPDLGMYYRVTLYRLNVVVVWDGEIRGIRQTHRKGFDEIEVICLGHSAVLGDAPYNRIWSDTRFDMWQKPNQISTRDKKYELWVMDRNSRLFIGARQNVLYDNANVLGEWEYAEPFAETNKIKRVTFDYDVKVPNSTWNVRLRASDNADFSGVPEVVWGPITATGTGTGAGGNLAPARRYVMFQIYYDNVTPTAYVGTDGDCYVKITNLFVKSDTGTTVTAQLIAQDVAAKYSVAAHGLSASTALIEAIALDLASLWVDDDKTGIDVMNLIAEAGNASGNRIGWAIWEDKVLVMETQPLADPKYILDADDAEEITTTSDLAASYQQAYPVYRDVDGWMIRGTTRDYFTVTGEPDIFSGRKRIRPVDVPVSGTSATAQSMVDVWLRRHGKPVGKTTFRLDGKTGGTILDRFGQRIDLGDVRADGILQVRRWRAFEAESASATNIIDRQFNDFLVRAEYDQDTDTLLLTPGEARPSEMQMIATLLRRLGPDLAYQWRKLGANPGV